MQWMDLQLSTAFNYWQFLDGRPVQSISIFFPSAHFPSARINFQVVARGGGGLFGIPHLDKNDAIAAWISRPKAHCSVMALLQRISKQPRSAQRMFTQPSIKLCEGFCSFCWLFATANAAIHKSRRRRRKARLSCLRPWGRDERVDRREEQQYPEDSLSS